MDLDARGSGLERDMPHLLPSRKRPRAWQAEGKGKGKGKEEETYIRLGRRAAPESMSSDEESSTLALALLD